MAADSNVSHETITLESPPTVQSIPSTEPTSAASKDPDPKSELKMHEMVVDMMSRLKLNPLAKEFIPASYLHDHNHHQFTSGYLNQDAFQNNQRRRNNSNNYRNGNRRMNGRASRVQREDSIRRTVYVSELDQYVTEEQLAVLFNQNCGQVVDCRICGDPHSRLRFAFVEFGDERSARNALILSGAVIGFYPIRVLPSKTAIQPVNPTFLPRSEDEREMCARTVYCTNIDKRVSQADVKNFFESFFGKVSHLRLLGDNNHSTRIAFVEFEMVRFFCRGFGCVSFA